MSYEKSSTRQLISPVVRQVLPDLLIVGALVGLIVALYVAALVATS